MSSRETPPSLPDRIERTASATLHEYARGLRSAFALPMPADDARVARYVVEWEGATAEVELAALEDFSIGSLSLARLGIGLCFTHGEPAARIALLERLDRYQQRGGG